MRYHAKIDKTVALPRNQGLVGTMVRGATAFRDGKPLGDNPYNSEKAPEFYRAWERGYRLASVGLITVREPRTRERLFCHEVERV